MVDFIVGDGGLELRIPVDQALAAIDQAVAEKIKKGVADGANADGIKGEPRPGPVAAAPKLAELAKDARLILIFPFPDPAHQLLAAEIVARLSFLVAQPALNDGLRGDAGVIGARHP